MMSPTDRAEALRQLADNTLARIEEEQHLEDQRADLLGYSGSFEEDVAEASSAWLEDSQLANLVRRYFDQLQPGRSIALRPGRVARVPLSPPVAMRIVEDLEAHAEGAHRLTRLLRGDRVVLGLTTDPGLAEDADGVELLGPTHPLVRVAARAAQTGGPVVAGLYATSSDVPPGRYAVGIYAWTRFGLHTALTLRFVAEDPRVEERASELLAGAVDGDPATFDAATRVALDRRHARLWADTRVEHRQRQAASTGRRAAALIAQRLRRLGAIQRQFDSATHPDIAAMKAGELRAAEVAFDRLLAAQDRAAGRADVTAQHLADVLLEVVAP